MTPRPHRLVMLGSILIDLVLDVPALPERGGDVLAQQVGYHPGGGFNIASAAARLGLPTVYAGPIGTGPMADRVVAALAADGIEPLLPPRRDQDTGVCITLVDAGGERSFVTVTGADGVMDRAELSTLRYRDADVLYVSGYDLAYPVSGPVLGEYVANLTARDAGGPWLVVDPSPLVEQTLDAVWAAVLPRADIVSCNDHEAGPTRQLMQRHASSAVLIHRQGPAGASVELPDGGSTFVLGYPVTAIDTTGAGDVHVGAMLAGLAQGQDWVDSVDQANRAAAFSVTRRGGAVGPTLAQLVASRT
jgi:ribokinase